jgi:hypothetical protein
VTTGQVADPHAPVNIAIDGCITDVRGNSVTVNGYQIDVGSDKTLKDAKVGDCVHIDGTLKTDTNKKVSLNVVKAQPRAKVVVSPDGDGDKGKDKPKAKPDKNEPGGAKHIHGNKVRDGDKGEGNPKAK